jgi:hypothetical protein
MLEAQLDEATSSNESVRKQIIADLARHPEEILGSVLKALQQPIKSRWKVAIQVIRAIGYPRNASALPILVAHIGNRNAPGWWEIIDTLAEMGPQVVVPHLIHYLWDNDQHQYWGDDVESLCEMLTHLDRVYAVQCGPTIAHILGRDDLPPPRDLDREYLLDVLEKVGPRCAEYALPSLLHLLQKEGASDIGKQASRLISSFDKETLEPYKLVLASPPDASNAGG